MTDKIEGMRNDVQVKELVRNYMKSIRKNVNQEGKSKTKDYSKKVIFTECRKGFLNGEYVDRLVIFMRGTGCSQVKEIGGCTFCGFYNATNLGEKVADKYYINQIRNVIEDKKIKSSNYSIMCLYNDGSLLNDEEMSFNVLCRIISELSEIQTVKKIVIESRVENITEEKLRRIRKTTNKEFEIAVGFESANPMVRDLCVNKSFDTAVFEEKLEITKKYNISIIPLLMVKPPFLTEAEAIEDFVYSLKYLEQFDLKRIDMELPTIEKNTLTYDLWVNGLYEPLKLWSAIEILRRKEELGLTIPIYISPMNYTVPAEEKASNCEKCNDTIDKLFEEYNKVRDFSIFNDINCNCKSEWKKSLLIKNNYENLSERIVMTINKLNEKI